VSRFPNSIPARRLQKPPEAAISPGVCHPRTYWTPCRISLSRGSPRPFRVGLSHKKNMIVSTTTTFHGGYHTAPRFSGRASSRGRTLLLALLPTSLLSHLPTSPDRAESLNAFIVWSTALRRLQHLHQTVEKSMQIHQRRLGPLSNLSGEDALSVSVEDGSSGERGRKGWTFRRTDNLRLRGA
jgi:hypothetical protein